MTICRHCKRPTPMGMCACDMIPSERVAQCPSDATACSLIVGYRLENGTDKAELYFLPGRLAQKTLDQMADLISDGWMVSRIIYSANAIGEGPPRSGSNSPKDVIGGSSPPTC